MNHFSVSELRSVGGGHTGKWHYTVTNDGRTYPTGYCGQGCKGHDTPEEAREHYREFLLDHAKYVDRLYQSQRPCKVCGAYTERLATVNFAYISEVLCDKHCNREELDKLIVVGESWQS